jgi:hypothetical protein
VPSEIQDATCATVESIVLNETNAAIKGSPYASENIGDYSYTLKDMEAMSRWYMIPDEAKAVLSSYVKPIFLGVV